MNKTLNILHLEDNQLDAELVKEVLFLEKINCTITNVDNKEDFLNEIEKENYELILADYSLPSFDGLSALKEVQNKGIKVPFILVSAVLGEELAIEALQSGATDYVLKSRMERLVPAIQRAIREVEERDQRKKLEGEIFELQAMYQKISERVRGFLKMDLPSGKYSLVDKFLEELSGFSTQEWYDTPDFIRTIIHPDSLEYYLENFKRMEDGFVPKMMEYRIIKKDGEERWWLQFTIGAFDINQKLVSVSIVIVDNTESKEAFIKYQNLFENALVGMYRTDISTGKIIEANENMAEIFGCNTIEELKKFSAFDFYSDSEIRDDFIEILTKNGFVHDYHLKLKKTDNTPIWVSLSSRIYPKEGFIEGVMIDISDQKKAQEELYKREQELEKVFENTGTATILVDSDMLIVKANNQLEILTGHKIADLEGKKKFTEFIYPEDLPKILEYHKLRRKDDGNAPSNYECRILDHNGNPMDIYLTVGIIADSQKSVASFLDITQRKKAEEALIRDRQAFQIIAEAALHSKDIVELCQQILKGLIETLDFEFGTVRLYNKETNNLDLVAITGLTDLEQSKFSSVSLDDPNFLTSHVARTKQALYAPDVDNNKFLKEIKRTPFLIENTKAFISWPILSSKNELIGTMQFIAKEKKILASEDQIFFESIARMFATGLERKIADKALQEMEKERRLLANIVENSNEVVIQTDMNGVIFYTNNSMEEVFGYTPTEIIGKHASILAPPGGVETQQRIFEDIINTGNVTTIETIRKHKDGTLIPVIMNLSIFKEEGTDKITLTAIVVDISDIKKLEATLKERVYELEVLNRITSASYLAKNMNELLDITLNTILNSLDFSGGAIYFINRNTELAIMQRSLGLPNKLVDEAKQLSIQNKTFKRVFIDGRTITASDFLAQSKGHMDFGISTLLAIPFFSKDKVSGALFLSTKERREFSKDDLTTLDAVGREVGTAIAKMKAEEELVASDNYLEMIFNVISNYLIVINLSSGSLYQMNRNLQKMLKYTDIELSKMKFLDLFSPEKELEYVNFFNEIKTGKMKKKIISLKTKNQNEIDIEFNFYHTTFEGKDFIIAINRGDF